MRRNIFLLIFFFCIKTFVSAQNVGDKKMFTSLDSQQTNIGFRNDILETPRLFYYTYEYLYNGGGVSIGDINNDGLQDIYFSSTLGSNKLYLNLGNFKFKDITEQAGVSGGAGTKTGINMIDINNDGWLDIYVCKSGVSDEKDRQNILYINNHDLTFTNKAAEWGLNDASFSTQAYFFDFDKDGDMDLYLVNHPGNFANAMRMQGKTVNGKLVMIEDTTSQFTSDRLYENKGNRFIDITKKAGITNYAFGLSAVINDFNNDGWPDIYVANDYVKPDFLYINNKNGTFTNRLTDYFSHISITSMGSDMNDLNNDGFEDLYVVDMAIEDPVRQKQLFVHNNQYDEFSLLLRLNLFYQYSHNVLQLNNGNGVFSEIAYYSKVAETDWSWGTLIADYDNDGWKDIYVANGYKRDMTDWDYKQFVLDSVKKLMAKGQSVDLAEWFNQIPQVRIKNYFFRNNGSLHFDNYSSIWSDEPPSFSNGVAYADLDNDGDLDLVVNNIDDEVYILKNNISETGSSKFLRFRFFSDPKSKKEIYGTTVKLYDEEGNIQFQRYDPQRGFISSVEHFLHFGTGEKSVIPKAEIRFPSGKQQILTDIKTDQVITVYESDGKISPASKPAVKPLFADRSDQQKFNYTHKEDEFIDFKREPLIPYRCSRKGPYYAKADVNGDRLDDIFIGGSAGNEGKLMIQNGDGSFSEKKQAAFTTDKNFEDCGASLFDADGDGDNDLYVVSGGSEFNPGDILYQDRLYLNDGKGNFTRSLKSLPKENYNGSFVMPFDFDGDGDQDLFVGGGVMPGKFPRYDKSFLLQNNKGNFVDVTDQYIPELDEAAIVNYSAWADVDGDKRNELIIAGEWMPVMVFKWINEKFVRLNAPVAISEEGKKQQTMQLNEITGWWNVVKVEDIDNDGDNDIIVGNRGMNSRITSKFDEPCTVYAKDFDNNGSYDAVLGFYIWGKLYPMFHRDALIDQMPSMRKKFVRYHQYADKTLGEIFSDEQKKGMDIYKANCFESGVFINEGQKGLRFEPFPEMAQLSNINDMIIADLDKDGTKDILVCGNSYDPDITTGNLDAMASLFLKGNGNGQFTAVSPLLSGLPVQGEIRKIISLGNSSFIFLQNNARAKVFSFN